MSQDLDRPVWMEDRLGDAISRLTTRIGEAGYAALTEAVLHPRGISQIL